MDPKWVMTESDVEEQREMSRLKKLLHGDASVRVLQTEYQIRSRMGRQRKAKPSSTITKAEDLLVPMGSAGK